MKKKKILIIEIIVLIVFMAILVVAFTKKADKDEAGVSESQVEEVIECVEVETPYATLKFPEEWTDRIRMETVEGDIYKVEFYGKLEGKEEVHLSDITFGGVDGHTIGFLTVEEETIPVNMIYYDLESDVEWTDDEMIEIQDMQRAVEFVMDDLVAGEGFEMVE